MNATYADRLRQTHATAEAGLPAAAAAGAGQRHAAMEQAARTGLPGLRDDAWRYANLRPVEQAVLAPAAPVDTASTSAAAAALLPERLAGFTRLVFVNGRFAPALSADPVALAGGNLKIDAVLSADSSAVQLAASADERFAWLNQAFATEVAALTVSGALQLEVLCLTLPTADAGASYPRFDIRVADKAQLTLVERHLGGGGTTALTVPSVQLHLGRHATAEHYRLQACAADAVFFDSLLATLGADSRYELMLVNLGALSARNSVRVRLAGDRAQLLVNAMSIADGKRVLDTTIQVEHVARHTRSEQLLRAIANGHSGIGFNSRVDVAATAGGADSQQSLKGLIGSQGAEVNLRPQLEISTDEVKASHGATTGALDENMLFYLLSRGLDADTARKLLEWAFIEDVMSRIRIPALRRQVELASVDRLGNATALEALR